MWTRYVILLIKGTSVLERSMTMGDVLIKARTRNSGKVVYEYRFEVASVDGKRQWKSKSGFATKREAKEAGKIAQQAYEHMGQVVEPSDMSYADFLDMWLEKDCKLTCKSSTLVGYEKKIRLYIKPEIGSYKLKTITKDTLQAFITKMYDEGYSINTVNSVKGLLTKSFTYALDRHYIISTPAINLVVPTKKQPKKTTRSKKHVYIPQEIMQKIFERFPEGSSAYIPIMIGYHTGLRLGDDDDKIRLNQRKPSKYKGLRRFGPEKNLQRINKFMKERPIFYKNLIQMKENIRFYLRCFYCITKVMILQFNSENRTELARNG